MSGKQTEKQENATRKEIDRIKAETAKLQAACAKLETANAELKTAEGQPVHIDDTGKITVTIDDAKSTDATKTAPSTSATGMPVRVACWREWRLWAGIGVVTWLAMAIGLISMASKEPASNVPAITCPGIYVAASTTTAGASCAGGMASDSPTCDFTCASGYEMASDSTITCGSDGTWPAHPTCSLGWEEFAGSCSSDNSASICNDRPEICSLEVCIEQCTSSHPATTNVAYHCEFNIHWGEEFCSCSCKDSCDCMKDVGSAATWAPKDTLTLPDQCIICPEIYVNPSTTTAGAYCNGGMASESPTCDFYCEFGYTMTTSDSSITCGSDGVWPAHPECQ